MNDSAEEAIDETSEAELVRFLEDPASYPHRPSRVELIQTHISYVALAPPYVYKIKKPVDFGFLDFSTLEKRRHFCHEEVRLNRRLCADTYVEVVPLSRTIDGLVLEDDRAVAEYAVKMKQLCDGGFLHQRIEQATATPAQLQQVAKMLVNFYRRQESAPATAEWGRIAKLRISTRENFEQMAPFVGSLLTDPALRGIREYTERFFAGHEPLFNRRRAEGHILDCHGDLRLEHIHVQDDAVCIFDCIEFSERLRFIDLANDVAFLAMDLDFRAHPEWTSIFVDRFVEEMDDPDLPKLLTFYKCYRACVRGKVEGMKSRESEVRPADRHRSEQAATRFFQLALNYATTGFRPVVVAIMGRIGSGKSTVARGLADALGWPVHSSDHTRKQLAGLPVDEPAPDEAKQTLYSEAMNARTYEALITDAHARSQQGSSTLLDATFGARSVRDALRHRLSADGVPCFFFELSAPEPLLRQRLDRRNAAEAHGSDARPPDFDVINAQYEPPAPREDPRHFVIDAEARAEDSTADIVNHLVAYHPDIGR